jgi:hypothetical protein
MKSIIDLTFEKLEKKNKGNLFCEWIFPDPEIEVRKREKQASN